jgi:predicted nuclease of restriction endonuclease-like (RecB) superfamily
MSRCSRDSDVTSVPESSEPVASHTSPAVPVGYGAFLAELKERIGSAQIRAAVAVNHELVGLYWQIGRSIRERQDAYGWGAQVIERLSGDLRQSFPEMKGFSARNLRYMRDFADRYPDPDFWQQAVAKLPWGHIVRLYHLLRRDECGLQ